MSNNTREVALAILADVTHVLQRYGDLRCVPRVDKGEDGLVTVTVTLHAETDQQAFARLELMDDMQYVIDVVQLRGFAQRYNIPPEQLEALLGRLSR